MAATGDISVSLWMAGVATASIAMGYTKWQDWRYQALRFGLPAYVVVNPLWFVPAHEFTYHGLIYVAGCAAAGASYAFILERYCRLFLGAAVIGGLALLYLFPSI